eukprot:397612-Amphidinium_carterae.1
MNVGKKRIEEMDAQLGGEIIRMMNVYKDGNGNLQDMLPDIEDREAITSGLTSKIDEQMEAIKTLE